MTPDLLQSININEKLHVPQHSFLSLFLCTFPVLLLFLFLLRQAYRHESPEKYSIQLEMVPMSLQRFPILCDKKVVLVR